MPLKKGKSKKVISENIREFHGGKTFRHTAAKFGKERANKQAIAVALETARQSGGGPPAPTPIPEQGAMPGVAMIPSKLKRMK